MVTALLLGVMGLLPVRSASAGPKTQHLIRAADLARALADEPGSPWALAWATLLWAEHSEVMEPAAVEALVHGLLKELPREVPPWLEARLRWYEAQGLRRRGRVSEAREVLLGLGFPMDWVVVGPFDNLGGSDRAFPPEFQLVQGLGAGPMEGVDRPVHWRRLPGVGERGRIDLGRLFHRADEVLAYVAVAMALPEAGGVSIRVGSSDGVVVFVDGVEVHRRVVRRAAAFDQDVIGLHLAAGWHRVMFKVLHEEGPWTLVARFATLDGGPLEGVEFSVAPEHLRGELHASPPTPIDAYDPFAVMDAQVETCLDAGSDGHAGAGCEARLLGMAGRTHTLVGPEDRRDGKDLTLLRRSLELAPRDPELLTWVGHAWRADENQRRRAYEQALAASPGFVPALEALLDHYEARDMPDRALAYAKKLASAGEPAGTLYQARVLDELGDHWAARRLLEGLADRFPGSRVVALELGDLTAAMGDSGAATRWFARAWELDHTRTYPALRLLGLSVDRGAPPEETLMDMRRLLGFARYHLDLNLRYAYMLGHEQGPAQALGRLSALERIYPDSQRVKAALGKWLAMAGQRDEALAKLREALALHPQDKELRDYVGWLSPRDEDLEERFAVPIGEVLRFPPPPGAEEVGAFRPLVLHVRRVHPNGMRSGFTQLTLKVLGKERVRDFQRVAIPFVPGEEAVEILTAERITESGEVHKATGIRVYQNPNKQQGMYLDVAQRVVSFSDLGAGDTIHLRYRLDEIGDRNMFGSYFGEFVPLQERIPRARVSYVLVKDPGTEISSGGRGAGSPKVTEAKGEEVMRWDYEDLPAIRYEPDMPGYPEVGAYIAVSTYGSWDSLARWYSDLIRPQLVLEPDDRALVRRIVAGRSSLEDKVRAIHHWVVKHTRYVGIEFGIHGFKPYRASRVLRRGYGDCKDKAALMVSMMDVVGIEADLALVRTVDRGRLQDEPALLWAFNHAIAYVPALDLFLDGTAEYSGLRELPYTDQGAMTLVVDHRTSSARLGTIPVAGPEANHWDTEVLARVDHDGALRMKVRERVTGQGAARLRRDYQDPGRWRVRVQRVLASSLPGVEVTRVQVDGVDSLDVPPTLEVEAKSPGYLRRSRGEVPTIPAALLPGRLTEKLARQSQREHPLVLSYPWSETLHMVVELPRGLGLAPGPHSWSVRGPGGSYTLEVTQPAPGKVSFRSHLTISARRVEPADYQDFRRLLLRIDELEARRIPLVEVTE